MFKARFVALATLVSFALAEYVHDLDDEEHLADLKNKGINLSENASEAHLKVSSNGGSTGYSWIVNFDSCADIAEITSGYVESTGNANMIGGAGEEIFTVTASGVGNCNFQIAYAQSWAFTGFNDDSNTYIISIPVRVLDFTNEDEELGYDGWRGESFAWNNKEKCDKETGECKLTEYDYGTDRADFIWFGVMSWFRSFDLFNFITFMPTAVTYTRLIRQNKEAAPKFLWMVRLWSHIGGWVTSLANMGLAAKLIANYANDVKNEDCTTRRGRRGRRR